MKIKNILASTLLLASVVSTQAFAYNYIDYCGSAPVRWSGSSKTMSAAQASFPTGSDWFSALQTAMTRVSEPINFTLGFVTGDTSVAIGNGESEVWFSSDAAHSPAVTYNYTTCTGGSFISESDVVFYNGEPYTTNMATTGLYGYGGGSRPLQTTAVHELGHAINMHHVNTEYNIMGQDYYHLHANGGLGRSYLGEDAADGAILLYGSNGRQDLSLVHWKWIGSSGQYSTHGHTKLYSSAGVELPGALVAGETRFNVSAGQTIQVELTAENNGASSQNAQIGFYLSTNNAIATSDTLITTQARTVTRDNVDTYRATITLPSGLPTGNYWVGAIIDNNNAVSEYAEDNNAAYWPVSYTGGGTANQSPVANFSFSANGLAVTFTDSSTDADGTIASRSWAFGDGTTSTATNPTKTFSAAGTYTVTLTVTDNQGATGTRSQSVTVGGTPPPTTELQNGVAKTGLSAATGQTLNFTLDVPAGATNLRFVTAGGSGDADLHVRFGSPPTLTTYDCRPYASGNSETCNITAAQAGRYYVMLNAYAAFSGVSLTGSFTAGSGNTPPVANFTFTTSGLTAAFTDSSTDSNGTIASRSWNFGDGTTSTATNPTKTYAAAGTYTVTLTATDNQGATNSSSKSVTVSSTTPPTLPECTGSDVRQLGKNCKRSNRTATAGNYDYMYISLPAGVQQLKITTSGGTGNANVYVSASTWATMINYQYSSTGAGNSETLTITSPPSGYVYISLHGASAFSGVTISTEY